MNDDIEAYLKQGLAEGWSDLTAAGYRRYLLPMMRYLDKVGVSRWADVQPAHLDRYLLSLFKRGLKLKTRRHAAQSARVFFRFLSERGRILSNPAREIAVPKWADEALPVPPLEESVVAEMLDSLPRRNVRDLRNRLQFELLYSCGLRLRESVRLNVADIDLAEKTLYVRESKNGKARELPLMRGVLGALQDYLALRRTLLRGPDHGALLLSQSGQRLNVQTFRVWLQAFNKKRGKKAPRVYPHLLRHSIAVHLLRGGADIRYVQEFLGHSNLDITKTYLRLIPGRLKEDYDKAMPEVALFKP